MLSKISGAMKGLGPKKPDRQLRLSEILGDSVNLHLFARYCVAKKQTDLLIAWIEVEQYKSANARLLRRHRATKMVQAYLDDDAIASALGVRELKEHIVKQYAAKMKDPPADLFDHMQLNLEKMMEKQLLPGFYTSPQYRDLFAANGDFNAILSVSHFDLLKFLGAGGFGMVLLVRHKATRRLYAMKVMDKRILISRKQVFSVFREKAALAHVLHPFIVSLKYALETEHHLLLVCDYEAGGNMFSNISKHGAYPLERARLYAAQMVLAISQMHEMGILYRDMKPDNILLDADGHCKLADMGAARGELAGGEINIDGLGEEKAKTLRASELQATIELEKSLQETAKLEAKGTTTGRVPKPHSSRMTITGTHGYRAPEVYMRSYGRSADWWNLGLLIVEMLTGKNPYRGNNRDESEFLSKNGDIKIESWFTKDTEDIVRGFLKRDIDKRLGCTKEGVDAIMKHPFFADIDWDDLMDLDSRRDKYPRWPQGDSSGMSLRVLQAVEPTPDANRLDYYCDMVDYLRKSMAARKTWKLTAEDQAAFKGFSFASLEAVREDLLLARPQNAPRTAGGPPRFTLVSASK